MKIKLAKNLGIELKLRKISRICKTEKDLEDFIIWYSYFLMKRFEWFMQACLRNISIEQL